MKKFMICCLILSLLLSFAVPALAAPAPFPDVYDETLQLEIDVLRMLGVVSGDENGYFNPSRQLTRAEFCKMAVVIMGKGDEEPLYRNRTIFSDVRSTHWARGYINLAVTGDSRIIQGNGDGTFRPDDKITFAQSVTILLRILGYSDSDAGMLWPQGHISLAKSIGLSEGIEVGPDMTLTRAQAAHLFCNMLNTNLKTGSAYPTKLGTTTSNAMILDLDVVAEDGSKAIRTSSGVQKTKSEVPESLLGKKGTIVTDTTTSLIIGFVPNTQAHSTVTIATAQATWVTDSGGNKYAIPASVTVYNSDGSNTYDKLWTNLTAGTQVTLYYNDKGIVEAVYIKSSSSDTAVVAKNAVVGNPFYSLTKGETQYKIIKNGSPATLDDIRQYDVGTYDKVAKILRVSDFRITGCYEKAWPNEISPTKITVMGVDFEVLSSAVSDVSSFQVGKTVTFLFTADNKIAGAVSPGTAQATAIGVVKQASSSSASVELLNGLVVSGDAGLSSHSASQCIGELVTVSSSQVGRITIVSFTANSSYSSINLENKTMGGTNLSTGLKIFERVGKSALVQITLDDLTQKSIKSSKILYATKDYSGKIGILILDDVTGDRYTYGTLVKGQQSAGSIGGDDSVSYNRTVAVKNHGGTGTVLLAGSDFTDGSVGGVAADASGTKATKIIGLSEIKNVSRTAFRIEDEKTILSLTDMEIPVADNVECYNKTTGLWFASLEEARAYSDTLTVYYDREPEDGGKVRIVVVS